MTKRSSRGSQERVLKARRQAQLALGKDPDAPDDRSARPQQSVTAQPLAPTPIANGTAVGILLVGEAAARLGMDRAELEAMIARGDVETLPLRFVRVIPTREVERLQRSRS